MVGKMHTLKTHGFTIVELLIVIVVIAILAAITIVSYRGIQNSAYDSSVQSDLQSSVTAMRVYKIDNGGVYPANSAQLANANVKASKSAYFTGNKANFYYCTTADFSQFAFVAQSKSGMAYYFDSLGGKVTEFTNTTIWNPSTANWAVTCDSVPGDYDAVGSITGMSYGNWASWVKD